MLGLQRYYAIDMLRLLSGKCLPLEVPLQKPDGSQNKPTPREEKL